MIRDYFTAEFLKLLRRPASGILGAVQVLSLVLFGYLFTYLSVLNYQQSGARQADVEAVISPLLTQNLVSSVLGNLSFLGGAVALIFGALAAGSEYGWGTLKLILSQRAGKLEVLYGKLLAVGAVLAVLTAGMLLIGAVCSALVSSLLEQSSGWPSLWQIVKGLGAGWLILSAWALLGFFLAIAFRGTSLAIGLGLAYAFVIEGLALNIPSQSEAYQGFQKVFLGENISSLAGAFGRVQQGIPESAGYISPAQAALVTLVYAAVFLAASLMLFRRRDL